jgi:cold shock CspA family protein
MAILDKFKNDDDIQTKDVEKLIDVSGSVSEGPNDDENKINGKIIKTHPDGWGFISSKDIPFTRIFFHWTSLKQDTLKFPELRVGMHVEFIPVEHPEKGFRAIKIKVT